MNVSKTATAGLLAFVGLALSCDSDEKQCADDSGQSQGTAASTGDGTDETTAGGVPLPLEEPKFLFEHNATDEDTGFQAFIDGVPWDEMTIFAPSGDKLLSITTSGNARGWGLTELFFETREPPNTIVPISELQTLFPEGTYTFRGKSAEDGQPMEATTTLSHMIPKGPVLVSPAEEAVVDPADLVIEWEPVTESLSGAPVEIVAYQVIVVKEVEVEVQGFGKQEMSVVVSPQTTSLTVSPEFLEPATPYEFEILALEVSGNQTISARPFSTM